MDKMAHQERKASMIAAINDGIDRIEDIKFIEQVYAMVVTKAAKQIQIGGNNHE